MALLSEMRIRQIGDSNFTLTVKRGTGLVRQELETEITRREFNCLVARLMPGTRMIDKRRYRVSLGSGQTSEIHIHDGHLAGFSYVEVEFSNVNDAALFEPPDWFEREVTKDVRFSYGTLARNDGMEIVRQILEEETDGYK